MHSTFAHDIALDRQSSLLHDAGVDTPASPIVAEIKANERAQLVESRPAPKTFSPASHMGLLLTVSRRSSGLAGV